MNLSNIFLLICCFTFCRSITPPSSEVELGTAPYFVDFRSFPKFCGATLIDVDIVLTAGHCLVSIDSVDSIFLSLGLNNVADPNPEYLQRRGARKILVHPELKIDENRIQAFNDLGLILLDEPVIVTEYVKPIRIGEVDSDYEFGTFLGFGSISATSPENTHELRKKDVKLINSCDCELLMQNVTYTVIHQCFDICTEKGACWGDSGGPFIQTKRIGRNTFEDFLVGVISWSVDDKIDCNKAPAVSMNVAHYRDWIYDGIKQMRADAF